MANENIIFRKGTLKELESAKVVAGSINFTTDEPAIYLDTENGRKRVGDLIVVQTKSDLFADINNETGVAEGLVHSEWSTTALYYIAEDNALLRWNGSQWTQLNPSNSDLVANLENLSTSVSTIQKTIDEDIYKKTEVYSKEEANNLLNAKANSQDVDTALSQKADKETLENLSATVSEIQDDYVTKDEKTTMEQDISNAKTAADAAQEAADAAQEAADTVGDNLSNLQTTVSNLSTSVSTTYETKDDANDKKITLETAIDNLAKGAVANNTTAIGNEVNRATEAESNLQTSINNLSTSTTEAIATAKSEAISDVIGGSDDTKDSNTINGVRKYVDNAMAVADAMTFKGVVDSKNGLPAPNETKAGDTYKVGELGYYDSQLCYVGDLLIAKEDNVAGYYHISSGYEDDYNTRLGASSTDGKVILNSPTGGDLGSVSFTSDENSSLSVEVTGDEDDNFIANSTVKISLVWGSFGTTN